MIENAQVKWTQYMPWIWIFINRITTYRLKKKLNLSLAKLQQNIFYIQNVARYFVHSRVRLNASTQDKRLTKMLPTDTLTMLINDENIQTEETWCSNTEANSGSERYLGLTRRHKQRHPSPTRLAPDRCGIIPCEELTM